MPSPATATGVVSAGAARGFSLREDVVAGRERLIADGQAIDAIKLVGHSSWRVIKGAVRGHSW